MAPNPVVVVLDGNNELDDAVVLLDCVPNKEEAVVGAALVLDCAPNKGAVVVGAEDPKSPPVVVDAAEPPSALDCPNPKPVVVLPIPIEDC